MTPTLQLVGLVALHVGLRLAWASGLGLGDDYNLRTDIASIVYTGHVMPSPKAYRVTWWLPTAFSARLFGLADVGLILPILVASAIGAILVYRLGTRLYGRSGGVVAALLLAVHPLDFAWSTMLTEDIVLSATMALTIALVLAALDATDSGTRRRRFAGAAVAATTAFYAKISAIFLGPALLAIAWLRRERLDRTVWTFVATGLSLFAIGMVLAYVFTGDPIAPYTYEIRFQGLDRATEIANRRLTSGVFWSYPRWLFLPNQVGDLPNGLYAWAILLLALAARPLGLRTSAVAVVWFAAVFLGYQFNTHRVDGVWVSGFRNLRHTHVFTYPLVLVLTGFVVSLLRARQRSGLALLAVLLAFGLHESVESAERTHVPFGELREAVAVVAAFPEERIWADYEFHQARALRGHAKRNWRKTTLSQNPEVRRRQIAALTQGWVVTGGAREPYYGCRGDCLPRAGELDPAAWTLVREWPPPPSNLSWWREPLRIWAHRAALRGGIRSRDHASDGGDE